MTSADDKPTLQLNAAALTDRGQRRKVNEDAIFHQTDQTQASMYLVCDGLGGYQAGEVASQLAIETVTAKLAGGLFPNKPTSNGEHTRPSPLALRQLIQTAITQADTRIQHYAQSHPQKAAKLGTTITLALIYENMVHIANVGDSRTYVYRAGQMTQITRDHSFAAKLVRMGKLDETELTHHPGRNVLYRSLGSRSKRDLEIDFFEWQLHSGDKLLLCSDGLWQAFSTSTELAKWLGTAATPAEICQQLVSEANRRDGSDNISAVVVEIEEIPGRQTDFLHSITAVFRKVTIVN